MFHYEIYYRLDQYEEFTTESKEIKAGSIQEILEVIKSIEKRDTIISIKNMDLY